MRCHTNVSKSLRRVSLVQRTLRQARCLMPLLRYLFYAPPNVKVWHKVFFGGSGQRAVAHAHPAFPKMPTAPSPIPLLGAPQAPGDKPNLPEGSKSLGGRPPEAEGNYPAAKTHSARSVPAASTAGRNATQQQERRSVNAAAAVFVPRPTERESVAEGLFFWWVRAQGRSAHVPGTSKKCLRPRRHSPY